VDDVRDATQSGNWMAPLLRKLLFGEAAGQHGVGGIVGDDGTDLGLNFILLECLEQLVAEVIPSVALRHVRHCNRRASSLALNAFPGLSPAPLIVGSLRRTTRTWLSPFIGFPRTGRCAASLDLRELLGDGSGHSLATRGLGTCSSGL